MVNTCRWCGGRHALDQLCQRAQRGMTRRSFCFLFGAGVAGLALSPAKVCPQDGLELVLNFNGLPFIEAMEKLSHRIDAAHQAYVESVVKPLVAEMDRQFREQLGYDSPGFVRLVTAQKSLQRS